MKSNGKKELVRAALIAADALFQSKVREVVDATRGRVELGLETDASPGALLRDPVTPINQYAPHVLFLDLGAEPDDGIRLAGILSRAHPGLGILASGPELTQPQLLEAMRSGISEVVSHQATREEVEASFDRVLQKMGIGAQGTSHHAAGKVLAFFSPKGGTGCTTVAMNVGIELQRLTGRKTLLVDLDLELGEIASFMGLKPRFHLVDLLKNFHRMDENLLTSYIERHESGVHVLSAPFEPETGRSVTADDIGAVIGFLRHQYDYVVVDTSKSLSPPALAAMKPADLLFPITNLDLCSLRNLKRCMPILKTLTPGAQDRIRLIVNRHGKNALVSLDDLESTVGLPVYATLSNDFATVIESLSTGKPLVLNTSARYAQEVRDLAAMIAGRNDAAGRRGTVLGRLFRARRARAGEPAEEALNHA